MLGLAGRPRFLCKTPSGLYGYESTAVGCPQCLPWVHSGSVQVWGWGCSCEFLSFDSGSHAAMEEEVCWDTSSLLWSSLCMPYGRFTVAFMKCAASVLNFRPLPSEAPQRGGTGLWGRCHEGVALGVRRCSALFIGGPVLLGDVRRGSGALRRCS